MTDCDWTEINLPLACFLNGSQPAAGPPWWEPSWLWLGPVLYIGIGMLISRVRK